jgi:uncharacterized membrane protein YebE (DUF533 family)
MDTKALLEQLLQSANVLAEKGMTQGAQIAEQGKELAGKGLEKGKELAGQGLDYATEHLGLPPAGEERDKVLKNLGLGAAAGSLLALLVGTKSGRKVLKPAVKLGSLAALGGLGYKVYTEWQKSQGGEATGQPIAALTDESANARSLLIIKAIIAAAKADGTIDAQEQAVIIKQIEESSLKESASAVLMNELQNPSTVSAIAAEAESPEAAVEIYLASLLMTDKANAPEQRYLSELAAALKLEQGLVDQLESEAFASA